MKRVKDAERTFCGWREEYHMRELRYIVLDYQGLLFFWIPKCELKTPLCEAYQCKLFPLRNDCAPSRLLKKVEKSSLGRSFSSTTSTELPVADFARARATSAASWTASVNQARIVRRSQR